MHHELRTGGVREETFADKFKALGCCEQHTQQYRNADPTMVDAFLQKRPVSPEKAGVIGILQVFCILRVCFRQKR